MLNLDKITLVAIDGVKPEQSMDVLKHCTSNISFGAVKLITFREPEGGTNEFQLINCPKFDYFSYNEFCIKDLVKYIDTDFVLIVQPDGFIANPNNWKEEFYNFDYIGAVFDKGVRQQFLSGSNVGNGGFCLRSKKFLEISSLYINDYRQNTSNGLCKNEDFFMCKHHGEFLKALGVKFAPEELAPYFSLESKYDKHDNLDNSFGFHGYHSYTEDLIKQIVVH